MKVISADSNNFDLELIIYYNITFWFNLRDWTNHKIWLADILPTKNKLKYGQDERLEINQSLLQKR